MTTPPGAAIPPDELRATLVGMPSDPELGALVRAAVDEARDRVRELRDSDRLIHSHYRFPKLERFPSGWPKVTHDAGPIDYTAHFKLGGDSRWTVRLDEMPTMLALGAYVKEHPRLVRALVPRELEALEREDDRFIFIPAAHLALDVLDRLLHTVGDEYEDEDFDAAWRPLEAGTFGDALSADVLVPVALTSFDASSAVELTDSVWLEPIDDAMQLARAPQSIWNAAAHSCVVEAATHAIVLRDQRLPEGPAMTLRWDLPAIYPQERVDLVFDALRVVTGVDTGYAQMCLRPVGWTSHYTADLPPMLEGTFLRRYPPHFDDYGWLRAPHDAIGEDALAEVGAAVEALESAERNLRLAARRLSGASLRDDEDDAIVDLCIGLEAALGDSTGTEMTYKLAIRAAAIIAGEQPVSNTSNVARQVKLLYDLRSKIVHGGDPSKARRKLVGAASGDDPVRVARSLLRPALHRLLQRPELRQAEDVDAWILGKLEHAGSPP